MIVSPEKVSVDTLKNLVTEFIGREGTDYGEYEVEMITKVEQVMEQIRVGEVVITYSDEEESVNLLSAHKARELLNGNG